MEVAPAKLNTAAVVDIAAKTSAASSQLPSDAKQRLEEMIDIGSVVEVSRITGYTVKEACTRMKPGKIDVTEGYSSDALLHGPDLLFEMLASVYRSFLAPLRYYLVLFSLYIKED